MSDLRVSVVIPCYNAAEFVPETIQSALGQTLREIEVIVVDDGSTDDSVAAVRSATPAGSEIPVRVIEIPNSGGPATPRNVGIDAASTDLVVCIDADDQMTPRFLELCVAVLDATPDAGIAYTDQQDFGASTTLHSVPEYDFRTLTRHNTFGNCSVFRKQAWEDVGGFDPEMLYEDWYFWLACGIRGHFGVKVHGVTWRYRVRDQGLYLTQYVPRDRTTKAQMVQRLPGIYDARQQAWAQIVLSGDPAADRTQDTVGVIPDFAGPPAPAPIGTTSLAVGQAPTVTVRSVRPLVSVIATACETPGHLPRALDSALSQHGLGGQVEVIVVGGRSTDQTEAALAAYGDRIRVLRQRNPDATGAVNHGLSVAGGEFIALLGTDDIWPLDRLARHVAALRAHPEVGLVHGDVMVTDTGGEVTTPSRFATLAAPPAEGRVLGRLLAEDFVSVGAATFRASLKPAWYPLPDDIISHGWWLAVTIACVAEIRSVAGLANTHCGYVTDHELGAGGAGHASAARRELPWRRRILRELAADQTVTAADLHRARAALQDAILAAAAASATGVRGVLTSDGAAAARTLAQLPRAAVGAQRSKALVRAYADDPFDGAVWMDLDRALQLEHSLGPLAPHPPLIELLDVAPLTLAWLDELAASPTLLRQFGAQAAAGGNRELVVITHHAADIAPLIRAVERDPHASGDAVNVRIVSEPATPPAMRLLASMASGSLTRTSRPAPYAGIAPHPAAGKAD